jgi:hypothetical protein
VSREHLRQGTIQLIEAVTLCFERKLLNPALVLLYSGIDIAGWLDGDDSETVRDRFTRWADKYVLPVKPLGCTALDLYAARCGVVHAFTSQSDLSLKGLADQIGYAWGTHRADTIQRASTTAGIKGYVFLQVEDLIEAFTIGVATFVDGLENDAERAERVYARAGKFLITQPPEVMGNIIRLTEEAFGIPASEWERPPIGQ